MVNDLHDSMKVGKGKEALEKILAGLIKYTGTHFADEEKIMKKHNYAGYEQHKKEHNLLVIQVLDLQKDYHNGNALLSQDVMSFLKNWLQKHIQTVDNSYGPFMSSNGVV